MIKVKKLISLIVIALILFSHYNTSTAVASQHHWASPLLSDWQQQELLSETIAKDLNLDQDITRGQFVAIINKVFNNINQQKNNFIDVNTSQWFYEDVTKAVAAGYIHGYVNNNGEYEFRADQRISRQETAAILGRVFSLKTEDHQAIDKYNDRMNISTFAVESIAYLTSKGHLVGYPDNEFKPRKNVTFAEAIKVIDSIAGKIVNSPGTYSGQYESNVIINTSDVVLKNVEVQGDLYLTQGVGEGDILLDNVVVHGQTYINGGGVNSIVINNSNLKGTVYVKKENGQIRIVVQGKSVIEQVQLESGSLLKNTDETSILKIVTISEMMAGQELIFDGMFDEIIIDAEGLTVSVAEGTVIGKLNITNKANHSEVNLENNSIIQEFIAKGSASVSGDGILERAVIESANVTLSKKPSELVLDGLVLNIGGELVSEGISPNGGGGTGGGLGGNTVTDEYAVIEASSALVFPNADIREDLILPVTGVRDTTITWTSSNAQVISTDGKVNRPEIGESDISVVLTATISRGNQQSEKTFSLTVKAKTDPYIVLLSLNGYESTINEDGKEITILIDGQGNAANLKVDFIIEGTHLMLGETQLINGRRYNFSTAHEVTLISEIEEAIDYKLTIIQVDRIVNSGIPIVIINTAGNVPVVEKDTKLDATMKIIDGSIMTYNEGLYDGVLEIKGRGNSTWYMPKKPYALSLANDSALLDMPEGEDWVLLANYADKSLMRNVIAMQLGESLGMAYTPRMRFVGLYLNGEYRGNYILGEKIGISSNRLDIHKLSKNDNNGSLLTGGYLIEKDLLDRLDPDDVYFETDYYNISDNNVFAIKEPKSSKITDEQINYIGSYFNQAEDALFSEEFADPDVGYSQYFNVDSLIDWYIVNEVFKNVDARFGTSVYMHKDIDGKIEFGPLWDFDLGGGNAYYGTAYDPTGFYISGASWINQLFTDPVFVQKLQQRWNEVENNQLSAMIEQIADTGELLAKSADENFKLWNILGVYVWPNANEPEKRLTYESEVDYLKEWLQQRINWLSQAISEL